MQLRNDDQKSKKEGFHFKLSIKMLFDPHSLIVGERGGLVVNASTPDPEVGGSSPTRVKPCSVLEQGPFTPQKYW